MMNVKLLLGGVMITVSTLIFAQQKEDFFKIAGDSGVVNKKDSTVVYTGNVSFNSPNLTFNQAEKVIVDYRTNDVKIYRPKNLKLIELNELEKLGEKKQVDYMVFNTKTKKLTL
ncbi:hypothetical protein [Chryseobacterium sp. Leaf394]|uniref:hypothetical protein n=1 Tax=Chryseobacterium sp. Leaf394 TaxID=1736361 RepID=UPI0006F38576|nr:hypothetical protein [Chryseobacterium sp. Leaf394]KQS92458.1 hypothetical protein ASG21_08455 [Chryseobacterium sp. Leaf394]